MMNSAQAQFGVGLRFGEIVAVASKPPRYKVSLPDADGMVTDWLLSIHARSKGDRSHEGLEVGEQVALLLDNSGEQGVILGAVYSEADPAPDGTWVKQFSDGTALSYDKESHALKVDCTGVVNVTSASTATVKAAAEIILDAPLVTVKNNLTVNGLLIFQGGVYGTLGADSSFSGNISWTGLFTLNGINVGTHKHKEHDDYLTDVMLP